MNIQWSMPYSYFEMKIFNEFSHSIIGYTTETQVNTDIRRNKHCLYSTSVKEQDVSCTSVRV